jgi:hypothetical protein
LSGYNNVQAQCNRSKAHRGVRSWTAWFGFADPTIERALDDSDSDSDKTRLFFEVQASATEQQQLKQQQVSISRE